MTTINFSRVHKDASFNVILAFFLSALIFLMPSEALAQNDAISNVLCAIVGKLSGTMGKGIATIAIVALGIGMFLGKLSWGLAVATGIGIGLIFGSAQIVQWLGNAGNTSAALTAACT